MSVTRILCEKCGTALCYCRCEGGPTSGSLAAAPGSVVVRWVVEVQIADYPDMWDAVDYPKSEELAHRSVAEWRRWLTKHQHAWHDVRLVREVTTREILPNNQADR